MIAMLCNGDMVTRCFSVLHSGTSPLSSIQLSRMWIAADRFCDMLCFQGLNVLLDFIVFEGAAVTLCTSELGSGTKQLHTQHFYGEAIAHCNEWLSTNSDAAVNNLASKLLSVEEMAAEMGVTIMHSQNSI